jgi:hypothetical protein
MNHLKIKDNQNVDKAKEIYKSLMGRNGYVDDVARKEFNTWQKRTKGYSFAAQATFTPIGKLALSGTAKMFLGFQFTNTQPGDKFKLNLNEEIIVTDGNAQIFDNSVAKTANEYFEYMRFLTGKDTLEVEYQGAGGQTVGIQFFYI